VLVNLTKPYRKVTLSFLAQELSLTEPEVESMLVDLIGDDRVSATIDQIAGYVIIGGERSSASAKTLQAIGKWAEILNNATDSLASRAIV
jgi:COP9 signalosome complex subunit 2